MKESLKKFAQMNGDKILYPGHGEATNVVAEQRHVEYWIRTI
jgi:hydroxyacylglutathione hydrolase